MGFRLIKSLGLLQCLIAFSASAQGFDPVPMRAEYLGEAARAASPVYYYPEATIETLKIKFQDGLWFEANGARLTSYLNQSSLYVITPKKQMILSRFSKHGFLHHSSLSRGGPVLAAGQVIVVDGVLRAMDLQSGHYRHPASYYGFLRQYLSDRGVDLSNVILGEKAVSDHLDLLPGGCALFLMPD